MNNQFLLTPFFLDQPLAGLDDLAQADWRINRPALPDSITETQRRMSVVHEGLATQVAEVARAGLRPVSVNGDCCATIGVMAGLQRAGLDPLLIWFDAHGDFNTWETTPSKFLGGMPLAMLTGRGEQTMPNAVQLRTVADEAVILTDARDLDPGERVLVENSRLTHLTDIKRLLDHPLPERPLYVHFDCDVVNPIDLPAVKYLAPGGPDAATVAEVFRYVARLPNLAAISLTAWKPDLDADGRSRRVCWELLQCLLTP